MAEEKIIIVPKARPAVDFASNLLVIPKGDFDEYVKEIDKHHVEFIRSLEISWSVTADGRAMEAVKMAKEKYEKIIAEKDATIAELKNEINRKEGVGQRWFERCMEARTENVRLKRALWLARAKRADDRARIFYFNDLESLLDIDGFSYDSKKKKDHKKSTARDWRITWLKVERKCRAKAEEYK